MKKLAVLLFAASAAVAAPASAQNLLTNGGFDGDAVTAGAFTNYGAGSAIGGGGWTVATGSVLNIETSYVEGSNNGSGPITFPAQAGANAIDLTGAGNTGASSVEQIIATVLGQTYTLSFYLGNQSGDDRYADPASLVVTLGALTLGTFTNAATSPNTTNWQFNTISFVGTGAPAALRFTNSNLSDNYTGLDSVSVTAVPEPASWAMMIGGVGLMGGMLRRRARRGAFAVA